MNHPPAQLRVLVCEVRDGSLWPLCIAEGDEFVSGSKAAPIAARPTMLALKAMMATMTPSQIRAIENELLGTRAPTDPQAEAEPPEPTPPPLAAMPPLLPPTNPDDF